MTKEFSAFEWRGPISYTAQQNKRALDRVVRNAALVCRVFYPEALGNNNL